MANYQNFQSGSGEFHDILVEVGFTKSITTGDLEQILRIILDTISSREAEELEFSLIGMSFLEANLEGLKIKLRFRTVSERFPEMDKEDLARQKANFVMHLFAKIDEKSELGDNPFPAAFRTFLDLSGYYGLDEN